VIRSETKWEETKEGFTVGELFGEKNVTITPGRLNDHDYHDAYSNIFGEGDSARRFLLFKGWGIKLKPPGQIITGYRWETTYDLNEANYRTATP
jgi:hypothetical protein